MNREELQVLIDKVIGKKGIMRTSAWWMRKLFCAIVGYIDEADSKKGLVQETVNGDKVAMKPNVFYVFEGDTLSITLSQGEYDGLVKEYIIKIVCTGTPSITLPSGIIWANDAPPEFASGKTYQISIIDNLAVVATFLNE